MGKVPDDEKKPSTPVGKVPDAVERVSTPVGCHSDFNISRLKRPKIGKIFFTNKNQTIMETIPTLVQEFKLRETTNAVCISVVKYTLDQFDEFFTQQNPAPAKLARQLVSCRGRYSALDDVYAQQMKAEETERISALDSEGDQLVYGVKGLTDAYRRMDFDSEKKASANRFYEFLRKHRIDPTENMISEWSKIQQFTDEWSNTPSLQADAAALGLSSAMARLAAIEVELRQLMTSRNDAAPEAQAVKKAREALYPEYRTLILLLNSFAMVDDDPQTYALLINRLNRNIDYVRQHAMSGGGGSSSSSSQQGGGSQQGGTTPEDNGGEQGGGDNGGTTPPGGGGTLVDDDDNGGTTPPGGGGTLVDDDDNGGTTPPGGGGTLVDDDDLPSGGGG